jgi:AraC-like DNA-binding protein
MPKKFPYLKSQPAARDAQAYLSRARLLMDRCYDRPLDLRQLSTHASFSTFHFIRLFRRTYKRTPHQYLTQKRVEKAKELLAATDLTVTEVCFTVGFQSLGSFSTLFHKHVGQPPTEYRARMLERRRYPHRYIPGCFLKMCGIGRPAGDPS